MGLIAELRRRNVIRMRLPQFPAFARGIGMSKVWDKYGAPDACRRVAPGEYACE